MAIPKKVADRLSAGLKRLSPDVRISVDELGDALTHEVLKRDTIEGEKAVEAQKLVHRAANKALRQRRAKDDDDTGVVAADERRRRRLLRRREAAPTFGR